MAITAAKRHASHRKAYRARNGESFQANLALAISADVIRVSHTIAFNDLNDISSAVSRFDLPGDYLSLNGVYDIDSFGSRLVYIDQYGAHGGIGQVVWLVDLETGDWRALNDAQGKASALGPCISGEDVVWSADRSVGSSTLEWQIVHHNLATGVTEIVDEGTNRRLEDGSPSAPATDLDAGLVAYTVESATDAWPYGWKIVIRRLSDGVIEREIQTRFSVWDVALDNGNVMYSEVPPAESGGGVGGLMLSKADHPEPVRVAPNGGDLAIDGRRIVWSGAPNLVVGEPVIGQAVFTATFDDLTPHRLSQPVDQSFGGRSPAAGDGMVVWSEPATAWQNLFMWDSHTNQTYQVAGQHDTLAHRYSTYLPNIGGGWLTWSVTFATDAQTLAQFAGLTLEDLRAAEPAP